MRARLHLGIGRALVVAMAVCGTLAASPLKAPKRMVGGRSVDLSPLFKWWAKHEGRRPLTAWVHVTGSIVGTNAWGWVVEAQVEKTDRPEGPGDARHANGEGRRKILLREPPLQDRAEFERLSAQLKAMNAQHTSLASTEAQAKNRADAVGREQRANRRNGVRSRELAAERRQVTQVQDQAKQQLTPLNQQIQELKKKLAVYPNADHYEVDCFALETMQESGGMPLYDHGQVY